MSTLITIFVRHSSDCKYKGDEFARRCQCRKHLRWSQHGTQYRRSAGTRSWGEAEEVKRRLEDQLAGRTLEEKSDTRGIQECIDLFIQDKKIQSVTSGRIDKYTRELNRLREFCERSGVFTIQGITRELLTGYCATWERLYPSSQTRSSVRARVRAFLRYCLDAEWIPRIPPLPKIKVDEPPTLPLTAGEYARLLGAVNVVFEDPTKRLRVRAALQLMRWSGLAIGDALTLERSNIQHDEAKGCYRIVTSRQKTGTHVSVPIQQEVGDELLAALNGNPKYVFWTGEGDSETITKSWRKYFIAPVFAAAKIARGGNMMSHRLRDTFAVDLLEKGVPMEEVSKLLGHESIKTTERHYAKWVKGRQDRLDSLVMETWKQSKAKRATGDRRPAI